MEGGRRLGWFNWLSLVVVAAHLMLLCILSLSVSLSLSLSLSLLPQPMHDNYDINQEKQNKATLLASKSGSSSRNQEATDRERGGRGVRV